MQTQIQRNLRIMALILAVVMLFGCALPAAVDTQDASGVSQAQKMTEGKTPPVSLNAAREPRTELEAIKTPAPAPTLKDNAARMIDAPITKLINFSHTLDKDYVPEDLVYIKNDNPNKIKMKRTSIRANSEAWDAFNKMMADAALEGVTGFFIQSIYRSYSEQKSAFNKKVKKNPDYGKDPNEPLITAREGTSEHQSGLAFDITAVNAREMSEKFSNTEQGQWLIENSYKYGFILRYPKGKEHITKIIYEPWHYRYVGVELARYLKENNMTMEEFYA